MDVCEEYMNRTKDNRRYGKIKTLTPVIMKGTIKITVQLRYQIGYSRYRS